MFGDKHCIFCRKKLKKEWKFCPNCGYRIKENSIKIEKTIPNIFSISFRFSPLTTKKEVRKNFYKKLEPKIRSNLFKENIEEKNILFRELPKNVEEPETEIKEDEKKRNILIHLPGVKSEKDIIIERYSQSIEIRAFLEDKIYFKLIPLSENYEIKKSFNNETLKIEINKNIFRDF